MSAASFVYRKPLAGRVVQKKPNGDYEDKNSFCFRMSVLSANCAKKQKEVITWMTWIVYRIRAGIANTTSYMHPCTEISQESVLRRERREFGEILRTLCMWKKVKIVEAEVSVDHVHMLLENPPNVSVSSFMGYLKGKSSLMIYEKYLEWKYKYRNKEF